MKKIILPKDVNKELITELQELCSELNTSEYLIYYLDYRDQIVELLTKIGIIDQIDVHWKKCEVTYEVDKDEGKKPVLILYKFTKEEVYLEVPFR